MSTLFSDLNRDGFTDLLVGNDWETPDEILLGQAEGLLRAQADTSPVPYTPTFSMGYDTGDVNNDGHFDVFAIEADFHAAEGSQDICHAIEGFGEPVKTVPPPDRVNQNPSRESEEGKGKQYPDRILLNTL